MPSETGVVAITGATGFLGSQLVERFAAAGWSVIKLSRSVTEETRSDIHFVLGETVEAEALRSRGIDTLIHCAYDFGPRSWDEINRVNVEGSRRLFVAAQAAQIRTVIAISTISAFAGCRSMYGRAKLEIEAAAAEVGAAIVRPGLVFGSDWSRQGGMFGSLKQSARGSVVPLIDGGTHCQYLIHVDDLFELLRRISAHEVEPGVTPITAASDRCWPMRTLLELMARRNGKMPRFVSVPWRAVWFGLRSAELAHLKLGYRSDSVVSLVNQDAHPDFSAIRQLGVTPREFSLT